MNQPRKKQQQDVFSKILPMLATPFILQTTLLPMVLMSMKFMLLSSMFLGKLAIFLWTINLIRNRSNDGGGLYSHNINVKHNDYPGHYNHVNSNHYGHTGDEIYGASIHKRKKRKTS
ncbi:hypothetical protein NQ314_006658 [Rhamnusium bicolor]|uniref:Uncharacterized protein n=1 Tax=Rhamnusium bicolor TaxID=1586634 RepID=A0AAV8YXP5_9CUCU|nr:hypothetical protein NQ314_006658 [Rhamnusium bicolor]